MSHPATGAHGLPFRLSVCARDELDAFAGAGVTHLLSIEDPESPAPTPDWLRGPHEQLLFHDLELEHDAAVMPSRDSLRRIFSFADACAGRAETEWTPVHLLIHCHAGRRRSTAAAYALAARAFGPGREAEALAAVRALRPAADPNLLMVRLADELLEREGELVLALQPLRNRVGPED